MPTPARAVARAAAAQAASAGLATVVPMRVDVAQGPFSDPDWTFELKYQGCRTLAAAERGGVQLRCADGADATGWFPEVVNGLGGLAAKGLLVDGEVCVLDKAGRSDAARLQARAARRGYDPAEPVVYCVFDVLAVGGRSVMDHPLLVRKKFLTLLRDVPGVLVVEHLPEHGEALFEQALRLGLPGVVAKRIRSPYRPGLRSPDWLKVEARPGA